MIEETFLRFSADKLEQLAGRMQDCLGRLTPEQIWMRGSENENAAGNLVLHLCGNVRQWIGTGVAGLAGHRDRDSEFAARGNTSVEELRALLTATIEDAAAVIRGLNPERLGEKVSVQKYNLTVLEAIYHVVEHFAAHTGQIIFATKLLTQSDLGYYGHLGKASHREKTP